MTIFLAVLIVSGFAFSQASLKTVSQDELENYWVPAVKAPFKATKTIMRYANREGGAFCVNFSFIINPMGKVEAGKENIHILKAVGQKITGESHPPPAERTLQFDVRNAVRRDLYKAAQGNGTKTPVRTNLIYHTSISNMSDEQVMKLRKSCEVDLALALVSPTET